MRSFKKRTSHEQRITIQLQSESGEVEVLEVDVTEDKKDPHVKEVIVEKKSEMCNTRRVSILDRQKKLSSQDERLSKLGEVAVDRRKELETLLDEDKED